MLVLTIVQDLVGKFLNRGSQGIDVQHASASKSQSRHGGPGGNGRWVAGDSDGRKTGGRVPTKGGELP